MPDHKIAAPDRVVKLTVNMHPTVLAEATRMARKRGVYVTEVIAEAIMREAYLFDQELEGKSVLLAAKNGDLFKVDMRRSRGTRRDQVVAGPKQDAPPAHGRGAVINVDFSRPVDSSRRDVADK
jgi:hypothetical protein